MSKFTPPPKKNSMQEVEKNVNTSHTDEQKQTEIGQNMIRKACKSCKLFITIYSKGLNSKKKNWNWNFLVICTPI